MLCKKKAQQSLKFIFPEESNS